MFAIESARNGTSFGLLMSSNSLLNLPTAIHRLLNHLKQLLDKNQRSYFTFLMNTLSITKMNNFQQNIDAYVLCSACTESIWLSPEHRQCNIPLVSVFDVLQAMGQQDEPTMKHYSFDLREILTTIKPIDQEQVDSQTLVSKHPNALLLHRNPNETSSTGRAWWGLKLADDNEEKTTIATLKEGKFGIAAGYTNEPI
jgi:hypothetical protein